ncbi:MAG: hypothetical protein P9X27_01170 [Candidatus Kaelpia aquatica]|nr:hypothetical protein [Candidatus Kaelpia aquatica]
MSRFKKAIFIVVLSLSLILVYRVALTAETKSKLSLSEKIDLLIVKQEEVLTKLDNVYDELIKIKIRISRKL